jgi:PadR family transcriptional regulator, regulatory protein AphA
MQHVAKKELPRLTTTSYAVLSLLSLQPWTTYELAKQMQRSLHWFWPRAESKVYEEPKKLVAHGLARSSRRYAGRRPSTVYTITAAGRRELAAWVSRAGPPGPVLEFEALLRVFVADCADVQSLRRVLESVQAETEEWQRFGTALGVGIVETGGPFPHRTHINALIHRFLCIYVDAVHRWAEWALDEVEDWSTTAPDAAKLRRGNQVFATAMTRAGDLPPKPSRRRRLD